MPQGVLVEERHLVPGHRTDAELLLEGRPDLPYHDHVERGVQNSGDLARHRDTTTWQGEDERVGQGPLGLPGPQNLGQFPAGLAAITEPHDGHLCFPHGEGPRPVRHPRTRCPPVDARLADVRGS